jgi:two-component system, OmpR family, sensor histidine kinase ChvG
VPDTASQTDDAPLAGRWRIRGSLSLRILAINILALSLVAGSIFYLDGFRARLIDERRTQQEGEIALIAAALASAPRSSRPAIIGSLGQQIRDRIRAYDSKGKLMLDSWALGPRTFRLESPDEESWDERIGRWLDAGVDRIVRANLPPPFIDQGKGDAALWPELMAVTSGEAGIASRVRFAPDRSLVLSAAIKVPVRNPVYLLTIENAKDVTELVRAERLRLFQIVTAALAISIALSLYLARTIVRPLQALARSALRVRLGRARDVVIPRMPERNDEIGILARALSDMTERLRQRIDATEAFAADVAHELKNPLASISSALQSLDRVDDEALRTQLRAIIGEDAQRMDRLITDISELSRIDAQLSRSRFEPIDLRQLLTTLIDERVRRDGDLTSRFVMAGNARQTLGDAQGLARVFDNLIDNALSFSPVEGRVTVTISDDDNDVVIAIEDDGPGVPTDARDAIFRRFHSDRPSGDAFGQHSGLGLAIARAIIEAHSGAIEATNPANPPGARFVIRLPAR